MTAVAFAAVAVALGVAGVRARTDRVGLPLCIAAALCLACSWLVIL